MILCTGIRTTIMQAVKDLRGEEKVFRVTKLTDEYYNFRNLGKEPRIILAGGYLAGLNEADHTRATRVETRTANYVEPLMIAGQALGEIPDVRICIVGSRSAAGSFDPEYAKSKAQIHSWALRQRLMPHQQLVVVAPPIIADSGMTLRRADYPGVLQVRDHCFAVDVARKIVDLLWSPMSGETQQGVFPIEATVKREPEQPPEPAPTFKPIACPICAEPWKPGHRCAPGTVAGAQ